ncbi:CAP domain-containing protein [Aquimarina hainanensis]|uniref:CAP domain-containing protein n=1 Tax=Aquimarina hainanensis TaxID=1578017 RepID=A0ABW5N5D0_9FLAO|nr:CAP domain-containing protein [Aquimarina sp. TRL1]QKX05566.1 CAP domain-containing protein [Aquimarina sp. TRL1]
MKKPLKILVLFLVTVSTLISCSKDEDDTVTNRSSEAYTNQIFELINAHRESIGLQALERNPTADQLAVDHTEYMISKAAISHDNFNDRSSSLSEEEGATAVAENVASIYPDPESVVNGWLNSSGHKANIEGEYSHTGIAAIKDKQGKYYYTQLFFRK